MLARRRSENDEDQNGDDLSDFEGCWRQMVDASISQTDRLGFS